MPFLPNPTGLSRATCNGEVTHSSTANSPLPWYASKVKTSAGIVLDQAYWEFSVSAVADLHVGRVLLKAGYELADPDLPAMFIKGEQLTVKVKFSNGLTEELRVNLSP